MIRDLRWALVGLIVGLGLGVIVFLSEPRLFCPPNWESGVCAEATERRQGAAVPVATESDTVGPSEYVQASPTVSEQESGEAEVEANADEGAERIREQEGGALADGTAQSDRPPRSERALVFVWWTSLALSIAGLLFAFADLRRLWYESRDLGRLERGGGVTWDEEGFEPSTVSAGRYVRFQKAKARDLPIGDWFAWEQDRAEAQVDPIGSTTQMLATVLLVLAVIGTFAGMRSALPVLVQQLALIGDAAGSPDLRLALTPVAEAFGANLVALLGSVSLGVIAFGAARSRDDLLLEIEAVSDDRLYIGIDLPTTTEDLRRAVESMSQTATVVADTRGSIDRLSGEIQRFNTDLRDAITKLRTSFQSTLQTELPRQMERSVQQISEEVRLVTSALSQTAVAYEGLVGGLEARDQRLLDLASELRTSSTNLQAEFQSGTARLSENLRTQSEKTVVELRSGVARELEPLVQAMTGAREGVRTLTETTSLSTEELLGAVRDGVAALAQSQEELGKELSVVSAGLSSSASAIGNTLEVLGPALERLAELTTEQVKAVDLFRKNVTPIVGSIETLISETGSHSQESRDAIARLVEKTRRTVEEDHRRVSESTRALLAGFDQIRSAIRETLQAQKAEHRVALDSVIGEMQRAVSASREESRSLIEAFRESAERVLGSLAEAGRTVELSETSMDRLRDALRNKKRRRWLRKRS